VAAFGGTPMRGPEESPNREEGLRMYSLNSAWFTFDEGKRGSLEPGKYADLAVLSDDYLTVPVEKVGDLHSVLTMVGGKVVYGEGPFAALEEKWKFAGHQICLSSNRGARDGDRSAARHDVLVSK
jgi:hypothetical protein